MFVDQYILRLHISPDKAMLMQKCHILFDLSLPFLSLYGGNFVNVKPR